MILATFYYENQYNEFGNIVLNDDLMPTDFKQMLTYEKLLLFEKIISSALV